ncbi:hypothetical protein F0562_009731 [Nyssa sinensis]|uniref:Uncharacterized protein n=1 Tax=Nyssa sinensis TaxID=561372 RepID=A0A5J5A030_9ASTE|nr:hypothetical protein F0562_009731 [Nyssa sinensis]
MTSETHNSQYYNHPYYNTLPHHPFLYPHSSSSRPPGIGLSSQDNTTHLLLDPGPYSHSDKDYRNRYGHGMKEEVDEHVFFSEASRNARSYSGSSMDDSWQLTPLTMGSSLTHLKQRTCSGLQSGYSYLQIPGLTDTSKQQRQDQYCYPLGSDFKCEMPFKIERDDEPQKVMHHFFDEWPLKNKDSWLDSEDKSSNRAPVSTTQLSISVPNYSHDFLTNHIDK